MITSGGDKPLFIRSLQAGQLRTVEAILEARRQDSLSRIERCFRRRDRFPGG
jgi:hypothetical protein